MEFVEKYFLKDYEMKKKLQKLLKDLL